MQQPAVSSYKPSKRNTIIAIGVGLLVAVVGFLLAISRASGFFTRLDPSKGLISGPAKIVSNDSGGNAIQFGPIPQSNPPTFSPVTFGRFLFTADPINSYQLQATRWAWHSLQSNHTEILKGIRAVNQDVKAVFFATPSSARVSDPDGYTTAVPPNVALQDHPDWLLKDSAGNRLHRAPNDDYALDIGNTDYQKASVEYLSSRIARDNWDGIVLDEINPTPLYAFPGNRPAKYPDDTSWKNATAAYVKYVCGAIRQRGKTCSINLGAQDEWAKGVALDTDGPEVEFFVAMDPIYANGQETATIENNLWKPQIAWAEWMENNIPKPVLHAATTKGNLADYALGSYLLVSKGKSVFSSSLNYGYDGNIYTPAMDDAKKLGSPVAERIEDQGGIWRRDYQNGQVLVNPHTTSRAYASRTLAPTSALILLK